MKEIAILHSKLHNISQENEVILHNHETQKKNLEESISSLKEENSNYVKDTNILKNVVKRLNEQLNRFVLIFVILLSK